MAAYSKTIIDAIIVKLNAITTANGYGRNVQTVRRFQRQEKLGELPALRLRMASETTRDVEHGRIRLPSLEILCVMSEDTEEDWMEFADEVERAVREINFETLSCEVVSSTKSSFVELEPEEPENGATVTVEISYETAAHDLTQVL